MRQSEWLKYVKELARRYGYQIRHRSRHLILTRPGHPSVFTSMTPSDHRVPMNLRAQLRRSLRKERKI